MLGTILADRYLRTAYHPAPAELSAWLARFGDQPEATGIRDLLERVAPDAAAPFATRHSLIASPPETDIRSTI